MTAPNGVQLTVCNIILICNFAPITLKKDLKLVLYFIFAIFKIYVFLSCGFLQFSISPALNLPTVNKGKWSDGAVVVSCRGGGGGENFPVYSS